MNKLAMTPPDVVVSSTETRDQLASTSGPKPDDRKSTSKSFVSCDVCNVTISKCNWNRHLNSNRHTTHTKEAASLTAGQVDKYNKELRKEEVLKSVRRYITAVSARRERKAQETYKRGLYILEEEIGRRRMRDRLEIEELNAVVESVVTRLLEK